MRDCKTFDYIINSMQWSIMCFKWTNRDVSVSSSDLAALTRVSIAQDHLAVAGLYPCLANRLQAKLNPAAGLQVGHGEHKVVFLVPQGHFLCEVVGLIEVEDSEEEEGELAVLGAVPGQGYAAAVP